MGLRKIPVLGWVAVGLATATGGVLVLSIGMFFLPALALLIVTSATWSPRPG